MNILPPSFKFDGDKDKATSYKAYAGQFYKLITTQAAKEGVPHVTRTKIFPDGTIINFKAQKNSLFKNWSGRVEIYASPAGELPSLPPVGSVTYWYNLSSIFRGADGAIYTSKPTFATEPFLELGATSLINSSVDTFSMKNSKVFDNMKFTTDGALLFNTDYELAGTAKAGSFTDSNLVVSTDMESGGSVTSTGLSTVDGFYSPGYSFITSVTQGGSSAIGYLDKIVGGTRTTKLKIEYNASPTKLVITIYHDELGTVVKTLTSEVSSFIYRSNPRFIYLHLAPDASFLSAGIQFDAEEGEESNSSVYLHTDIVIKLDSNGVWADPVDGISHSTTVNTTLAASTPTKSDYRTSIDSGVSICINEFRFQEYVIRDRVKTAATNSHDSYIDLHCAIIQNVTHKPSFHPTTLIIVSEGVLRPGSYEDDFEALVNYPIVSISYTYGDSNTSCFTSVHIIVDLTAEVGTPYTPGISVGTDRLTVNYAEKIVGSGGAGSETYTIVKKGSPVYGILYDGSKYEDSQYIRYWIDGTTKFKNKENIDVTTPIVYSEEYSYTAMSVWKRHIGGLFNDSLEGTITLFSHLDAVTLNGENPHGSLIGTVSTDATNVLELSINGTIISTLRQGGLQLFPFDTSEIRREIKYTVETVFDAAATTDEHLFYRGTYPYCKDIIKGTDTAPTNDFFGNVLSSNQTADYAFVIKSNNTINILTSRPTTIPFNKIVDATLTGTAGTIAKFTNGFQTQKNNYQQFSKEIIENSLYGTGVISALSVSSTNTITNSTPPSRNAIIPSLSGGSIPVGTTSQVVLNTPSQIFYQGIVTRGFYYKYDSGDYIASVQTNFGSLYPSKSYYVILNGSQMPALQNITSFNSFVTTSRFGIGYSI